MLKWVAPFDPNEKKDYSRDWTAEMDFINDTISVVDFDVITPDSGVGVASSSIDASGKIAVVWFLSDDLVKTRALNGTTILIDHTITTSGGRIYNETLGLKIKEK